ncbi:MAG TPA: DUF2269 family protein [Chloroflexia bacterium]|jgi:uncharacterized membrane protein
MVYLILKWLHILLAIAAIGTNLTYSVWLIRASKKPEVLPFTLRGVKILDDWIANPSYVLLLITGVGLVLIGAWPLTTPWILVSLVLYVLAVVLGLLGYTPTLRQQIKLVDSDKHDSEEYAALDRRGRVLGIVLAVLVVVIVFLMVVKPGV